MIETNYDDMLVYLNILLKKANKREIFKDIAISPKGLERIIKLISYAKKQEQLLELYKELVREIKDYMLGNINDIDYSKSVLKVNNLDKQIKELENDK